MAATAAPRASSAGDAESVRVAVRARPLVPSERAARAKQAVFVAQDAKTVLVGTERSFPFDVAFGLHGTQKGIYDDVVAPLMEGCFHGARWSADPGAPCAPILAHARRGTSDRPYTLRFQRDCVLLWTNRRGQDVHDGHRGACPGRAGGGRTWLTLLPPKRLRILASSRRLASSLAPSATPSPWPPRATRRRKPQCAWRSWRS